MARISFLSIVEEPQKTEDRDLIIKQAVAQLPIRIMYKDRVYRTGIKVLDRYEENNKEYFSVIELTFTDQSEKTLEVPDTVGDLIETIGEYAISQDMNLQAWKESYQRLIDYVPARYTTSYIECNTSTDIIAGDTGVSGIQLGCNLTVKDEEKLPIIGPIVFKIEQINIVIDYIIEAFSLLEIAIIDGIADKLKTKLKELDKKE